LNSTDGLLSPFFISGLVLIKARQAIRRAGLG
jgi:hypothetical protein